MSREYRGKCHHAFYSGRLPQKLEAEAEARLLKSAHEGDAQARATLIENNLRLVIRAAQRFSNTGIAMDELTSIGTMGLIKAVDSFKPDLGYRLSTYAMRCITNEILMTMRREAKQKNACSLETVICDSGKGEPLTLSEVLRSKIGEPEVELAKKENIAALERAMQTLSARERQVIGCLFGLNGHAQSKQAELAARLGIGQSCVSRIRKRALEKLSADLQASQ